ncbi:hypothetical protein GX586_14010 [bacterium]|nr:hypothetical protein [bacterium]
MRASLDHIKRGALLCIAAVCTMAALAGCSTMATVGYGAALPLAAAGDTALIPFQFLGKTSKAFIAAGEGTSWRYGTYWGASYAMHRATPWELVYYVPGYALAPFLPFGGFDYYALTAACWDEVTSTSAYRRRRIRY